MKDETNVRLLCNIAFQKFCALVSYVEALSSLRCGMHTRVVALHNRFWPKRSRNEKVSSKEYRNLIDGGILLIDGTDGR